MRLDRLDLTRYGKFTDHVVDFGSRPETGCDLHIVYGPNEAGKSTLFNGWLDLLFGIGAQSSYNFLHPYPTMQIGAAISFDGQTREFIRRKRAQSSLFDARDQPISEGALLAGLGGLDRDSYKTMFSLDDETLEQGGESILASRGDLGELLFSASAGLGGLSQQLALIRGETEEFYKYRARSGRLADLKSELAGLKSERDRLDVQASDYARLAKAHEDASRRHAEASSERKRIAARLAEIDRLLAALPRLGERQSLVSQIEPLTDLPDAAPEWRGQIRDLRDEEAALEAGGAAIAAEIDRLTDERDAISVDQDLLKLKDRIADLDRQRTRHNAAEEDLPERRSALSRIQGRIEHLLAQLGRSGEARAEDLLLETSARAALRDLIDARTSLDVRLATARREAADARVAREETLARLSEAGAMPDEFGADVRRNHITALSHMIPSVLEEAHGPQRQAALRALPEAREKRKVRLNRLLPWRGEDTELEGMAAPSAELLRGWKSERQDLQRKLASAETDIDRLTLALNRHEAEATAIAETRGLPSAEAAEALRKARDAAWSLHMSALDAKTAQDFEAAMQAFDAAADKRAGHQSEVARLNEAAVQIAILRTDLDAAIKTKAGLASAWAELESRFAAAVRTLSPALSDHMTPETLEDWLALRDQALEACRELRELDRQLEAADADRRSATLRLARALSPLDSDAASAEQDLELLLARARDVIARDARLEAERQLEAQQARALVRREHDLRDAEEELSAWLLAWKAACADTWLGKADRAPTAAEIREALPVIADLAAALNERAALADRIAKMEEDRKDYATAIMEIARQAAIDVVDASPASLARELSNRLALADKASARHADLTAQIEDALARRRLHAERLAAHAHVKKQMLNALGADTLTDAALNLDRILERKALAARLGETERQIRDSLGFGAFEDALAHLVEADAEALKAERQALDADFETLDADVQELHAARTRASSELAAVGGDDAVAMIEQRRQTTLLAIAQGAEHYLALSAGVLAMEQALALYRERHRSTMMARASDAIRTISRGRYTGLASQPDKGRELLIALQNDGSSKQATEMSKGARFQLYLALRVAGFHEFARTRPPVPFVADDIMETFDDFRAEEAFRLFADMAGVGQVIYLTHHRHLCDIARTVCPDVTIHQLEP